MTAVGATGCTVDLAVQQISRLHVQRIRNLIDDFDGRVSSAALDVTDIGPMQACIEREIFLRQPLFKPQFSHIRSKALLDIHALTSGSCRLSVYRR
jgi:hypothetical protein